MSPFDRDLLQNEVVDRVIANLSGYDGTWAEYQSLVYIYDKYTDGELVDAANKLRANQSNCCKCNKLVSNDKINPERTIDVKTGCDTFNLYCDACHAILTKMRYGNFFEKEPIEEEPFTPLDVYVGPFPWDQPATVIHQHGYNVELYHKDQS